jgi:hypothetical protein
MPNVSSPVLLDHAIGAVFEDFGTHPVEFIRKVLVCLNGERDGPLPAARVIERILPGARLKPQYAHETLYGLWVHLDIKTREEQTQLQEQFAALLAKADTPARHNKSFFA